ncbi:MAG: DUF4279 domain-containing protein [Eubacteriales bacterium]|nr:DUF4279 domain-containing protein [Eubacteriales bacterium]
MDNFPHVKVSFVVEGKSLNLKELTEELDILPTETRGLEDWPEAIKNNLNLPEELQPRYVWCIDQEADLCKQIEIPINRIITQMEGKEQKLLDFCRRNHLSKTLCIVIHAETMNMPEIVLSSRIVSYFGELEAEIDFDIYTYESNR